MTDPKPKRFREDWRCHTTVSAADHTITEAWGVWLTGPHRGLTLEALYPDEAEAMSAAREALGKGWSDEAIVRRVTLGPIVRLT